VSGLLERRPLWRRDRDVWLFLTPEVEREVPGLLASLDLGAEAVEQDRIETLVHRGGIEGWFAYLRDVRSRLERAAALRPEAEAVRRLALVLREQYLLVPSIREERPADLSELERLEELTWTTP
jgi:hypothetical protein